MWFARVVSACWGKRGGFKREKKGSEPSLRSVVTNGNRVQWSAVSVVESGMEWSGVEAGWSGVDRRERGRGGKGEAGREFHFPKPPSSFSNLHTENASLDVQSKTLLTFQRDSTRCLFLDTFSPPSDSWPFICPDPNIRNIHPSINQSISRSFISTIYRQFPLWDTV